MKKIVIFASGEGTTADYLINEIKKDKLKAQIVAIVVDRDCEAIQIAKKHQLPCAKIVPLKGLPRQLWDQEILQFLKASKPDCILLLGFLRCLGKSVTQSYANQIINSHPSLLPAYGGKGMYGSQVHKAVINNKDKKTGVTVHYVNENYDEGQIIAQKIIDVVSGETYMSLEDKVKKIEKGFLLETLIKVLKI
ncbi:MAG: phosphoribosylglycinamide formyltransferase [Bdellovibrionaceae bacterium]|nr:phosphoribosylglycinamide formyltransferase [Pseudobdellovibrionaceae bacterium]